MPRRIVIIQGHPDAQARHFCHALADEYAKGAEDGGHDVMRIEVGKIDFPILRLKEDFEKQAPSEPIRMAQESINWADHLVIIFPLWLGTMPALLKAFFEQVLRPGFAFEYQRSGEMAKKLLAGKSARIIVTMGMPAFVYRWFFLAHGVKNLERNILGFCGIRPIETTLIGTIEGLSETQRAGWLDKVRGWGGTGR